MPATRPVILAALQTLLKSGVTAVSNRVYLPWDNPADIEDAPMLQIAVEDGSVDPDVIIGQWEHTISIRIAAVVAGKFNYQTTWDILNAAATAINANPTLTGQVNRIEITGAGDSVTVAGDKILWPHLSAIITYRTAKGSL